VDAIQELPLEKRVVRSHTCSTLSLSLTHDVLQNFDYSENYSIIFFVFLDDFHATTDKHVLDFASLPIQVSIKVRVDFN